MSTHVNQTCMSCKCSKPASHFGLIGGRRRNKCIKCVSATSTNTQVYQRPQSGTKYCIGCNEVYEISNYQSDPKDTTGLNTYCYNCKPHLLTKLFKPQSESNKSNPTFFSNLFNAFCFKQCVNTNSKPEPEQNPNRNPTKKKSESYTVLKLLYGFN
jgi:hypothetical protein